MRLILVLNGLRYPDLDKASPQRQDWFAERRRSDEAARILGLAFREYRKYRLVGASDVVGRAPVWQGTADEVPLVTGKPLSVTLPVESHAKMKMSVSFKGPIAAPIAKGQQIGTMTISAPDFPQMKVPLYAANSVDRAGIFGRMFLGVRHMITGH
jgi:D-alanyl-D-alanine carboxypeptidase (penicillin-binding protein 5/6)